jgi:hypothetical protein
LSFYRILILAQDSEDNQRTARMVRREFPIFLLHDRLAVAVLPVIQSSDLNRERITEISPLPSVANGPTWWTPALDRELLWGCYLHGYGRWHDLREDTALAFPADASNDWKADEDDDDGDGDKKPDKKLKREPGSETSGACADALGERQESSGVKADFADADSKNRWPSIQACAPSQFVVRFLSLMTFCLQVLQNRLRRLLDDKVIEAVKQRERERTSQIDARLAKMNAREEEKQRRNQEKMARLSQWNLKDGWGLLRVLQESGLHLKYSSAQRHLSILNITGHSGIPTADPDTYSVDWARLLREIGVEKVKTESNADDYYVDMINRCRRAVFLYGASASSGATKGHDTSTNQGKEAEFEDPDDCNDVDVIQSNHSCGGPSEDTSGAAVADKKRVRKPKGAPMDGPNPLELPKQSFRVLQRVQAISTVRRMIFRPSLNDEQRLLVIKSAPSCGVAGWTAEHDLALLSGVNRHAFEWDSIRADPDLPFVPQDLESFIEEGKVALLKDYKAAQRIEQLCDLFVTEPWVQAKPIPQIKRPSHMARRSGGKRNRKKSRPSPPLVEGGSAQAGVEEGRDAELNEGGDEDNEDIDADDDGVDEGALAGEEDDDDDEDEEGNEEGDAEVDSDGEEDDNDGKEHEDNEEEQGEDNEGSDVDDMGDD